MKLITSVFLSFLLSQSVVAKLSPQDQKIYGQLKKELSGHREFIHRTIKRIGNRTVRFEALIATEMNYKQAEKILSDFPRYEKWALKNINFRPDGTPYRLKIVEAPTAKEDAKLIMMKWALEIPLFDIKGLQPFRMSSHDRKDYLEMKAVSTPRPKSVIESAIGTAKIFPVKGDQSRVWIHAVGDCKLRSGLLYEALPERLLNRLVASRVKTFLNNYVDEQDRLALANSSSQQRVPTKSAGVKP